MARRKVVWSPADLKRIEAMAGLGMTTKQIAVVMGVAEKTFFNRINDTPDAKYSVERGRANAVANVSKTAYELATNGKQPTMTMFWLKCRAKWKETTNVELTGKNGESLSFVALVQSYAEGDKAKQDDEEGREESAGTDSPATG